MPAIEVTELARTYRSRTGILLRKRKEVEALRGRNVSLFAAMVTGSMLLLSGANVSLERLPGWVQRFALLRSFEYEGRRSATLEAF